MKPVWSSTSFSMSRSGNRQPARLLIMRNAVVGRVACSPKRMLVDFIASHAVLRANRMMTLDANRSKQTSLVCGSSSSCAWAPPPC